MATFHRCDNCGKELGGYPVSLRTVMAPRIESGQPRFQFTFQIDVWDVDSYKPGEICDDCVLAMYPEIGIPALIKMLEGFRARGVRI